MRRVIFNQKGGVGKSSIASNLAAICAHEGKKTLVVDLDIQANTTHYLMNQPAEALELNIAGLFDQSLNFRMFSRDSIEFVHETPFPNLSILPSNPELEYLEGKLESRYKIYKLSEALDELDDHFDEVFIDTPPALNFYTRSALIAAQRCLIPFDCDDFSRKALYTLLNSIREIQDDHNEALEVEGIIVNQFQPRARLPQQLLDEMTSEGLPILPVQLSASVKMRESHQQSRPLIHMAPKHKLTQNYVDLYRILTKA